MDDEARAKFDAQLYMPPAGATVDVTTGPWSVESEMAAFTAAAARGKA